MKEKLDTNELTQRFILHEGCVLTPYICPAGYLTIGIGHNLDTNPLTVEEKKVCGYDYMKGIAKNAAFYLLRNDLERCEKECIRNIPFYKNLDAERQYALLDMNFQLGNKGLLQFKKMLSAMGSGFYKEASEHCLDSKYAKQTPVRAKRIANVIRTGRWVV